MGTFSSHDFLPRRMLERLTELRVSEPDLSLRVARNRKRRKQLSPDGRLQILAADHPARRVTGIGQDPLAMADRGDLLARIVRSLMSEAVDGVMATMDIVEELLILHELIHEANGNALLDEKLLIVSLNRGGLAQAAWEMDDPMTGATTASSSSMGLDGAKILLRICDDDPGSLRTLVAASRAIGEFNQLGLPTFLEPLPVERTATGFKVVKTPEALARIVGVASALGDSSRFLWLKLPYCDNYAVVARATTLPILLLGGESSGDTSFLQQMENGLAAGANVRGVLVGRNSLYPGAEDPLAIAEAIGGMVHNGWSLRKCNDSIARNRGRNMDWIAR